MKKTFTLFVIFWVLIAKIVVAQTTPTAISGLKLWLDAANVNNNGTSPADNTAVTVWKDRSGAGNDATVLAGENGAVFYANQINGQPVLRFSRNTTVLGSVYEITGLDIRAKTLPAITVFTVYKQGAHVGDQAVWGCDDGGWDRFFFSSFPNAPTNADNGGVSQGTYANVVPNAGIVGATRLLTAVYDSGNSNGSAIYFNGQSVAAFTDQTTTGTDAIPHLNIGWDGTDNAFNGDIAEMIVYNRKLTDCEIQQVNRYLGAKYGIAFSTVNISAAGPTTFAQGGNVTLSTSTPGTAYQWLNGGAPIVGANSSSYIASTTGTYQVAVTNSCVDTSTVQTVLAGYTAPGNALALNGSGNYAEINSAGTAATNFSNSSFTIEAWVKPSSIGNTIMTIFGHKEGGALNPGYSFNVNSFNTGDGKLSFEGLNAGVGSSTALLLDVWSHVAVTYTYSGSGNTGTVVLYLNGQVVGTGPITIPPTTMPARIGAYSTGNYYFNGAIDEVRIWNTAKTQAQIQASLLNTVPANSSGLIAYYNFDQGLAGANNAGVTTLNDQSGNGYSGTLNGFALTGNTSNWVESYAMVVPTATAATAVSSTGFTANWTAPVVGIVENYYLDVSTDPNFATFISGYQGSYLPFSATSKSITGLTPGTTYYYRVRANKTSVANQGGAFNSISVSASTITTAIAGNTTAGTAMAGTAAVVDNTLTVTGSSVIPGATIAITSNLQAGDVLGYTGTLPAGVTSSYNSATGILTFTGNSTAASYQTLLRTVTLATSASTASLAARPISFTLGTALAYSGNGHFYEYVNSTGSWATAKAAASAKSLFGLTGYLATVTSAGENAFITQKLSGDGWLGGSDDYSQINTATGTITYANQSASEGNFYWITGPEAGTKFSVGNNNPVTVSGQYANWNPGEPNNSGGENFTQIFSTQGGRWNDLNGTNQPGFVVEYGGLATDPALVLSYARSISLTPANPVAPTSGGNVTVTYTGTQGTLSATAPTGATVDWYDAATAGNKVATGTNLSTTTTYKPSQAGAGTYTYYAEARDNTTGSVSTTRTVVTLTISPAALTVTAANQTKVYGAANPTLTATYTGFVNSETSASLTTLPTIVTTATTASGAGTYAITASGAASANYTISYAAGTLTVNKAALTIAAVNQTKVYGAANPTLTATYTGFVNSETSASLTTLPTIATTATITSAVNTYPITASGAVSANYTFTYTAATLTVTKAPLTITAANQSKVYGAANPTLTATYTGFVNSDTNTNGLTTQPALSTTATAASAAGTYTITASAAASANYTITYAAGTLTVNPAVLTVTAVAQTKVYNTANPALTVTYGGFVNSDDATKLSTAPTATTTAVTNSNVGTYAITASGGVSANYTFTYVGALLTITPATRTLTFANINFKTYGDADFDAGAFASTGEPVIYSVANTAVLTVNGNNLMHIIGAGITNVTATVAANANYSNIPAATISISVNKAAQTITFSTVPTQLRGGSYDLSGVTASSGLPVSFTLVDNTLATITGQKLNSIRLGNEYITALQPGNANYFAAANVIQLFKITDAADDKILVHQAMSPNGDGVNDFFYIEGIQDYPNNTVTIFNRNSVKIFELQGYDNNSRVFTGLSNINGKLQQVGTFFYLIKYVVNGAERKKTGWFVMKN